MEISVTLENQYLPDRFTKHALATDIYHGVPNRSFPIYIKDVPTGAKSLALTFVDFDSTPVCGFTWIHWLAANLPVEWQTIPENASFDPKLRQQFIQGKNSSANKFSPREADVQVGYNGPQPPDKAHDYTLTVYALDTKLPLQNGYWLNEFRHAIQGHVLAKAKLELPCQA